MKEACAKRRARAHLGGGGCEAASRFAGALRLNGGIEGEQVRLGGDLVGDAVHRRLARRRAALVSVELGVGDRTTHAPGVRGDFALSGGKFFRRATAQILTTHRHGPIRSTPSVDVIRSPSTAA
jgi:hypothetical protein